MAPKSAVKKNNAKRKSKCQDKKQEYKSRTPINLASKL